MYLSHFGLISLDGSVTKLEPGLDFSNYQIAMSQYQSALRLRDKLREDRKKAAAAREEAKTDCKG
jgi:hypothetical protein